MSAVVPTLPLGERTSPIPANSGAATTRTGRVTNGRRAGNNDGSQTDRPARGSIMGYRRLDPGEALSARRDRAEMDAQLKRIKLLPPNEKQRPSVTNELIVLCEQYQQEDDHLLEQVKALQSRVDNAEDKYRQLEEKLKDSEKLIERYRRIQIEDLDALEDSCRKIRSDILKYDSNEDNTIHRATESIPSATDDHGSRSVKLIQLKFQLLEDLIFILKKRDLKYENNLYFYQAMNEFGNLQNLLDDNARLRSENTKLRIREQRYYKEPLLRRRRLTECDPAFMRMLVMSLQNELSSCKDLIDAYNLERNPTLGLLVKEPIPIPDEAELQHLDDIVSEVQQDSDLDDEWSPKEFSGPTDVASLSQRVAQLEYANASLQSQIDAMKEEREMCGEAERIAEELQEEIQKQGRWSGKEKRLVELEQLSARLANKVPELNKQVALREETIEMLQDSQKASVVERQLLAQQNVQLSERNLKLRKRNKDLSALVEKLKKQRHLIYNVGLSLVNSCLETALIPIKDGKELFGYYYRDFFSVYMGMNKAVVKIQSWARGQSVRKLVHSQDDWEEMKRLQLERNREAQERMALAQASEIENANQSEIPDIVRPSETPVKSPTPPPDDPNPQVEHWMDGAKVLKEYFIPSFWALAQIISHVEEDTQKLIQFSMLLKTARTELRNLVKKDVSLELKGMFEYMQECSEKITGALTQIVDHPKRTFGIQTAELVTKNRFVQTVAMEEETPEEPVKGGKKK